MTPARVCHAEGREKLFDGVINLMAFAVTMSISLVINLMGFSYTLGTLP